MKIIVAVLFIAFAYVVADLSPAELDKVHNIIKECKTKIDVTDDDVALFLQHKVPETETGKCFGACIKKSLGVLDKDNKVDIERIKKLMEHVKDKAADKYDAMMKVFETCAAEVPAGPDECEVSTELMKCVIREFKASGVKISFMNFFSHTKSD